MEEDAEGINAHHVRESFTLRAGLQNSCCERQQASDECEYTHRLAAAMLAHDWINQHDQNTEEAEDQLGQNADVIKRSGDHRPAPVGSGAACAGALTAVCRADCKFLTI